MPYMSSRVRQLITENEVLQKEYQRVKIEKGVTIEKLNKAKFVLLKFVSPSSGPQTQISTADLVSAGLEKLKAESVGGGGGTILRGSLQSTSKVLSIGSTNLTSSVLTNPKFGGGSKELCHDAPPFVPRGVGGRYYY